MQCTIVIGSHRRNSQSTKVGTFMKGLIEHLQIFDNIFVLDLQGNPLPWYDDDWKKDEQNKKTWDPIYTNLDASDAFIFVSPEWNGMVPPGLKNFFILVDNRVLAHKPALIVTVSDARGGSYPIAELRMSSYKNTRVCYIPEHIIVRNAPEVLNTDGNNPDAKTDEYLRHRIPYALRLLRTYADAFIMIRKNATIDHVTYKNGM